MIEVYLLITGFICLALAGYQDFKTRKPFIIMPALTLIGLAVNPLLGAVIAIFALFTLYGLPNKVNEKFGKADIFLLGSFFLLLFFAQSQLFGILITTTCLITLATIFIYSKKKPNEMLPFVGLFALSFFISLGMILPVYLGMGL